MSSPTPVAMIIYDSNWTKKIDDKFIDYLHFMAVLEKRPLSTDDHDNLEDARKFLADTQGTTFDYYDIYCRFQLAHKRYVTWNWIIHCAEVDYDEESNTVTTTTEIWGKICKIHKMGALYIGGRREHMWKELKATFGHQSAREFQADQKLLKPKPNTPTLDELLADIRATAVETTSTKTEVVRKCDGGPPDVMSTTKGKGKRLDEELKVTISVEMNTESISGRTSKGSCSTAKRSINF